MLYSYRVGRDVADGAGDAAARDDDVDAPYGHYRKTRFHDLALYFDFVFDVTATNLFQLESWFYSLFL